MNENSFSFYSPLSEERKREIADWYNSLSQEHQSMVDDIRRDGYLDAQFDHDEEM